MTDRHQYAGAGVVDSLAFPIGAQDQSLSGNSLAGWPTSGNPFVVVVGRGGPTEEKILCLSRSGTTLSVSGSGRGYDGTAPQAHAAGEPLILYIAAVEFDQLNAHGALPALDEHTQYMLANGGRHDLAARHLIGVTLPTSGAITNSAPGDTALKGVSTVCSRADHLHGREAAGYLHDSRQHWFGAVGTLGLTTSHVYFVPFRVWAPSTLSQVQVNVTVGAGGGSVLQTAFFADAGNHPAAAPFNAGSQAADTAAGILTLGFAPTALGVGLWWIAIGTVGPSSPVVSSTAAAPSEAFDVSNLVGGSGPGLNAPGAISAFNLTDLVVGEVPLVFGIA